jgi:ribonuclease Z
VVTNNDRMGLRIVVLGSGPALASASQDNTFFLVENETEGLLIDCGGSPFHKVLKVGAEPNRLKGVILTHAHPDHIYGLPSLVHELWLYGRRAPLRVFANRETLTVALALLDVFGLRSKPVPLEFDVIPSEEEHLVMEDRGLIVQTSPVKHEVPTVGVKITAGVTGKAAVFSADTSPCPALVSLARGAALLFCECTVENPHPFHSTPRQVGEIAAEAGVGEVVLVHYHHNLVKEPYLTIAEIGKRYPGPVRFAKDFDVYQL